MGGGSPIRGTDGIAVPDGTWNGGTGKKCINIGPISIKGDLPCVGPDPELGARGLATAGCIQYPGEWLLAG